MSSMCRSNQPANLKGGGKPGGAGGTPCTEIACIFRAAGQRGILDGNQFGSVAAREQSLQEQQRLMLPSAKFPSEVDNERAHAQASPGFGHERCVSFSPASSRPSLRYLR